MSSNPPTPDPTPAPNNPAASAATTVSGASSDALIQAITDLRSAIEGQQTQLNSVTENLQKINQGVAGQANFDTTAQGTYDPYENVRRDRAQYDTLMARMQSGADALMGLMLNNFDLIMKQHMRITDVAASGHWQVPTAGAPSGGGASSQPKPTA